MSGFAAGTREAFEAVVKGRHPGTVSIMRHFAWAHLPQHLQVISAPIGLIALEMVRELADSPELAAGLRKLLEAKDCLVRCAVDAAGGS
jgi:hypothetical protein